MANGMLDEVEAHESFKLRDLDERETELIGCIYIDPTGLPDTDGEIAWWVRDDYARSDLDLLLETFVPRWIAEKWPLQQPRFHPPSPDDVI